MQPPATVPSAPPLASPLPNPPLPPPQKPSMFNRICSSLSSSVSSYCPDFLSQSAKKIGQIGLEGLQSGCTFIASTRAWNATQSAASAAATNGVNLVQAVVTKFPALAQAGKALGNNYVAAADTIVCGISPQDKSCIQRHRENLRKLSGNPHFDKTISFATQLLGPKLEKLAGDSPILKAIPQTSKVIPEVVEGLILTAFDNLASAIPQKERTDNLLQDILTFLIKTTKDHIEGNAGANIEGIRDDLKKLDPSNKKDLEKLRSLFAPLHKEFIKIAFPNGIKDFGFGLTVRTTLNIFVMPWLKDPALFVELYKNLIDPIAESEKRYDLLKATAGGRILLQATKLGAEKGPELILQLLEVCSPVIAETLVPDESHDIPKIAAEKQACRFHFTKKLKEIAQISPPKQGALPTAPEEAIGDLKKFGGYLIESILTKTFINLAEKDGKLKNGEDPLPHVVKSLKDILKKFYNDHGKDLRAHFVLLKNEFKEHREKTLRLIEITKLQAQELKKPKGHRDPRLESKLLAEIREINQYLATWNITAVRNEKTNKDELTVRGKLIENIFKPFAKDVLKETGMDKPDGLKMNFIGLNELIQSKIPEGFCFLFEFLADQFPGLMDWLDPETALIENTIALNLPEFSSIAKAASTPITHGLSHLFKNFSEMISEKTLTALDEILPVSIHLKNNLTAQDHTYLITALKSLYENIASREQGDQLFKFISLHVNECLLKCFIKNSKGGINPIIKLIEDAAETLRTFYTTEGRQLKDEYDKLSPKNLNDLDNLFKELCKRNPNPFEKLFDDLLKNAGLSHLLINGKLAVFDLQTSIRSAMVRALFNLHYQMTHLHPKQEAIEDQLSEALYDRKRYERTLNGSASPNSLLAQIHAESANPIGKKAEARKKLWQASGTAEYAEFGIQASEFFSDLTSNFLRAFLKNNSNVIVEGLSPILGLQASDLVALRKTFEELASDTPAMEELWEFARKFLNISMLQAITNTIESTVPLMPRTDRDHRQKQILGDLSARITQSIGEHMKKIGADAHKIKIEMSSLIGRVNNEEYHKKSKELSDKFLDLAKKLVNYAKGNKGNQNPLDVLSFFPYSAELWEKFPEFLSRELASIYNAITPDIQPLRNELFEIYKSNHVAEYCRLIAECIRDVTPFSLVNEQGKIGKQLFGSLQQLLKNIPGKGAKKLHENFDAKKDALQALFGSTIGQIGANMDRDGVMKEFVWPFLENYSQPLILSVALKFSQHMREIENNDPAFMLKMATRLLEIFARHLKRINEVTQRKKESAPYKIPPNAMKEEFGQNLHPAIKNSVNASEEDTFQIRLKEFYLPFSRDLIEFLDFTKDDVHAPEYLKEPLFQLLQNQLTPLALSLMFDLLYKEDGKEAMLDKIEANCLFNLKAANELLSSYASAAQQTKPTKSSPSAKQQECIDNLRASSGKFYHEFVQMIPEWLTQQILSLGMLKKMTADQLANMSENMFNDWPPTRLIDQAAEKGLPAFRPGQWKGEGEYRRFVPHKKDFDFNRTQEELERSAIEEEKIARDNKCTVAEIAARGISTGLKTPLNILWKKFIQGLIWFCNKIFGSNSKAAQRIIIGTIRYISRLIHWVLTPFYYIVERILYGIMKIQSGFVHKTIKMEIHKNFVFEAAENSFAILKAVKQDARHMSLKV